MKVSPEAALHDLNCGAKVGFFWWFSESYPEVLEKLSFAAADVHIPTKAIAKKIASLFSHSMSCANISLW